MGMGKRQFLVAVRLDRVDRVAVWCVGVGWVSGCLEVQAGVVGMGGDSM